jgi:two-component system cell cycle sensor histidine kinase/response regulator CckA
VYLPATEPGAHPFEPDAPALEPSARRILVVDDDPGVRRVACSALERNGWNVDVACDGVGALEAFEKAGGAYDLLLLDATMPDVSGLTLLERMRRIRRDVPVLVTSGYSESDVRQRFATSDVSGFVGKPFTPQLLASRVEALLGKS